MFRGLIVAFVISLGWGSAAHARNVECDPAVLDIAPLELVRDACTLIIKAAPDDRSRFQALKTRGRAFRGLKQYDAAIGDFEKAIKINPNDPQVHERLGWAAYGKGDYERAFREAANAIEIDPQFAAGYDLLGVIATTTPYGGFKLARKSLDEAVRLQPNQIHFRINRVLLFEIMGKADEGVPALDAIENDFPAEILDAPNSQVHNGVRVKRRTSIRLTRGEMLSQLGRINEAREQFDRAIADESGALTYAKRADFLLSNDRPEGEVLQDLDKALVYDPDFWLARFVRGRISFYAHQYQPALEDFTIAAAGAEKNGRVRWWKALTLRALGRPDEAAKSALEAVVVDGKERDRRLAMLQKRGYLGAIGNTDNLLPAITDAMTACMLDKDCG